MKSAQTDSYTMYLLTSPSFSSSAAIFLRPCRFAIKLVEKKFQGFFFPRHWSFHSSTIENITRKNGRVVMINYLQSFWNDVRLNGLNSGIYISNMENNWEKERERDGCENFNMITCRSIALMHVFYWLDEFSRDGSYLGGPGVGGRGRWKDRERKRLCVI